MVPDEMTPQSGMSLQPDLEDEERICQVIARNIGISVLDHQLPVLRDTLRDACRHFGYQQCRDFVLAVQQDPRSVQMEFIISRITVGESYFFRDASQFSFLRDRWLPQLLARKRDSGDRVVRIWSAGCAMGQEIYSVAILLAELLPDRNDWLLHLTGTDINGAMIAQAAQGCYRSWSLRATPDALKSKYFTCHGPDYQLAPEIRSRVRFGYLNLVDDCYPSLMNDTQAIDLILCRNVFIYFSSDTARSVMGRLRDCLNPGGILLLGPSDLLYTSVPGLSLELMDDAYYYRRQEPAQRVANRGQDQLPPDDHDDSGRMREIRIPKQSFPEGQQPSAMAAGSSCGGGSLPEETADAHISACARSEMWHEMLEAAHAKINDTGATAWLLCQKATALANLGKLQEAHDACLAALGLDVAQKEIYLVMGLVLTELDRIEDAQSALRKAIYLDRDYLEAHYRLGVVQFGAGRIESAINNLRNAMVLAEKKDADAAIENWHGLTYGRLVEILKSELEIYCRLARTGNC